MKIPRIFNLFLVVGFISSFFLVLTFNTTSLDAATTPCNPNNSAGSPVVGYIQITTNGVPSCVRECTSRPNSGIAANSTDCVETDLGLGNINLSNFFPKLSFNDLISSISTIILAVLVIFLGFKVIFAGYKWINNDNQDKNKKEAIKSITNGVIGIVISFAAYFVVLFVRSLFGIGGNEQLVNCANLYFKDINSYQTNYFAASQAPSNPLDSATPEFSRCIQLSGKSGVLSQKAIYALFVHNIDTQCPFTAVGQIQVTDRQKLNQCFIDELNKL